MPLKALPDWGVRFLRFTPVGIVERQRIFLFSLITQIRVQKHLLVPPQQTVHIARIQIEQFFDAVIVLERVRLVSALCVLQDLDEERVVAIRKRNVVGQIAVFQEFQTGIEVPEEY